MVSWGHRSQASAVRRLQSPGCRDSCPMKQRGLLVPPRVSVPAEMGGHTPDWGLGGLGARAVLGLSSDLGKVNFLFWPQ